MPISDYCRQVESYLCQKNDGHLIRVVGPSFDLVAGWATQGVPLKVAFSGIDRAFERYHRQGPRRRPLKIDFCDADVRDAFDEWRRAVGLPSGGGDATAGVEAEGQRQHNVSLPAHLERAVMQLTAARARGSLDRAFDQVIDAVARELDAARSSSRGLRGEPRQALITRLSEIQAELLRTARTALDEPSRAALISEAEGELAAFRNRMLPDAFARAREAAFNRLVRERFGLPILTFDS